MFKKLYSWVISLIAWPFIKLWRILCYIIHFVFVTCIWGILCFVTSPIRIILEVLRLRWCVRNRSSARKDFYKRFKNNGHSTLFVSPTKYFFNNLTKKEQWVAVSYLLPTISTKAVKTLVKKIIDGDGFFILGVKQPNNSLHMVFDFSYTIDVDVSEDLDDIKFDMKLLNKKYLSGKVLYTFSTRRLRSLDNSLAYLENPDYDSVKALEKTLKFLMDYADRDHRISLSDLRDKLDSGKEDYFHTYYFSTNNNASFSHITQVVLPKYMKKNSSCSYWYDGELYIVYGTGSDFEEGSEKDNEPQTISGLMKTQVSRKNENDYDFDD